MEQFFKTYEETKQWLELMRINIYTINSDLTVDVDNFVDISAKNLSYIPVQFGVVESFFDCSYNRLISLIGSPKKVGNNFNCSYNLLTSLKGTPKETGGYLTHNNPYLDSITDLPISLFKKSLNYGWYVNFNYKIKQEYFKKHIKDNSELIDIIKNDIYLQDYYKTLVRKNKLKEIIQ